MPPSVFSQRHTHVLPREWIEEIRAIAQRAAPNEACGILIGRAGGTGPRTLEVMPARNQETERPNRRYRLAPEDLLAAERAARARGLEVLGFWHSHPETSARPSRRDGETAWEGYSYVIVSLAAEPDRSVRSWRWSDGSFAEEDLVDWEPQEPQEPRKPREGG